MRRTKIVATMGPATDTPESIEEMLAAGVDVVRMNFSHGEAEDHIKRAQMVRDAADRLDKVVAILGDLQGPKIRIDRFENDKVVINDGDTFILDPNLDRLAGTQEKVGIAYKDLPRDVVPGDELLLDDGRIVLEVSEVKGDEIHTKVTVGGALSNNKGINKRGGGISADALTEKDKEDIKTAAKIDVDFLAVSFPRNAADLDLARKLMKEAGGDAAIVSKIERAEAVEQPILDEIILASDVIMVARGDLGVEIGDANLPLVQKKLIKRARNHMGVKGIGALTESGTTALWMSRISSGIPIYAMTTHKKTCRKVAMYRGVYPVFIRTEITDPQQADKIVTERLTDDKVVSKGDLVITTRGDNMGAGADGGTNQMKIIKIA